MKNISKWLLAGSILTVAFACQPKKTDDADQNNEQQNGNGCGQQSSVEKAAAKPHAEAQKPCTTAAPVVEKETTAAQPAAEKKAAPISVPAQPVAEQKAAPAAKEKAAPSPVVTDSKPTSIQAQGPVSSAGPIAAPVAPEVKAEISVKSAAPSAPSASAIETPAAPAAN